MLLPSLRADGAEAIAATPAMPARDLRSTSLTFLFKVLIALVLLAMF